MKYGSLVMGTLLSIATASASFAAGNCEVGLQYVETRLSIPARVMHVDSVQKSTPSDSFLSCVKSSIENYKIYFQEQDKENMKKYEAMVAEYSPQIISGSPEAQFGGVVESSYIQMELRQGEPNNYCHGEAIDTGALRGLGNILKRNNPNQEYYLYPEWFSGTPYPSDLNSCIKRIQDLYIADRAAGKKVGSRMRVEFIGRVDQLPNSPSVKAEIVTNVTNQ